MPTAAAPRRHARAPAIASGARGGMRPAQGGFIYMALLVFFGVFATFAGAAMISGAILQRRNAEEQLIFVGGEFRNAIKSYHDASAALPPGAARYPANLEDLLADTRAPGLTRHLRQIYPDPLTGRVAWGTVPAPEGGIMGVYSLSPAKAVKLYGFPAEFKYLEGKTKISEWLFVYVAPAATPVQAPPSPASVPPATAAPSFAVPTDLDPAAPKIE